MKKFEVGERVAVYGCIDLGGGWVDGVKGRISKVCPGGVGWIEVDVGISEGHVHVHPKQCRRCGKRYVDGEFHECGVAA